MQEDRLQPHRRAQATKEPTIMNFSYSKSHNSKPPKNGAKIRIYCNSESESEKMAGKL